MTAPQAQYTLRSLWGGLGPAAKWTFVGGLALSVAIGGVAAQDSQSISPAVMSRVDALDTRTFAAEIGCDMSTYSYGGSSYVDVGFGVVNVNSQFSCFQNNRLTTAGRVADRNLAKKFEGYIFDGYHYLSVGHWVVEAYPDTLEDVKKELRR